MNHEQMMNSDGEMSMQQCFDGSNAEMNHEIMNFDGEQMQMPNDDAPSLEN